MSRYRSYGRLDDQYRSEGDTSFARMNNRLRPTQLQPSEVQLSQNGRMDIDGNWQPRKGLLTLAGAITIDADAIRLPFVISAAQRQSNVVTLTLASTPNTAFVPGNSITIEGLTDFGSDDPNGTHTLTAINFSNKQLTFADSGADKSFGTSASSLICPEDQMVTRLAYVITNASVNATTNVATLTSATSFDSAFTVGDSITVGGLGFTTTDPNGVKTIASVSGTTLTYSLTAGGNETYTTSANSLVDLGPLFIINDDGVNEVFGSALFSDPTTDDLDDYIFTATNNVCSILRLRDSAEFKVKYPGATTINQRCDLLQAFNKMYIFRNSATTLESTPDLTTKVITSASRNNNDVTINSTGHGLSVGKFATISGLGNYFSGGNPNGVYKVVTVPSVDSFTYTFAASSTGATTYNSSGALVEYFNDFTSVASGDYTMPTAVVGTNLESTNGITTITTSSPHGLSVGQEIELVKSANSNYVADLKVVVSGVPTTTTFSFNHAVEDIGSTADATTFLKKVATSYFVRMPAAPFGIVNQRRLWLPYFYDSASSPVKRPNMDEIIASDILDDTTFDVIGNQFRVTGGASDFIVGLEAFTENTLLVFCRRSIHRLTGVSGSLQDVQANVITPDLGCSARRSIAQVGNRVLFLSDQGVYALTFLDEYNLRGLEIPISEAIKPTIDRINQNYIDKAVGTYFNNRYYLAIPVDGSNENNLIVIYNFINNGWESIDQVNSLSFNIRDMIVGREGTQNALYITTSEGGVHKIEGFDGGDQVSVTAGVSIPQTIAVDSILQTREYDAESIDRKIFASAEVHLKSEDFSITQGDINFTTTDPDRTRTGDTIQGLLGGDLAQGEDASIRAGIRLRGYGCSVEVKPTAGRPFIRTVKVDARLTDRSRTSAQ